MLSGEPYCRLGVAMDGIARRRNVRGPYKVGRYVNERTGGGLSRGYWSQIFRGKRYPGWDVMDRFCRAFELGLGDEEFDELARTYLDEAQRRARARRRGESVA